MRKRITIQIFFLLLLTNSSLAQISIPASTIISENFNLIGPSSTATLPLNWKMSSAGTGGTSGWTTGTNITNTTQAASSGSPTTGGAYNWATTAGTDRAIGFMTDGSYASPNSVMAFYRNNTGSTVTTITVLFAIERYRVNTSAFSLSFFSSTDGSAWTARPAGDISEGGFATAASAYNFASPKTIYKTVTITGLSIANNGDFYLRWVFTNTGSINSQGLALDDVSLFAGPATPGITAKLLDMLTIDNPPINQANPGDQLTYRTTIKNTGTGDANAVNLTIPAPTNTTLVSGSVKTSALAKDDSYTTPFNTVLTGNNVITNDFGLPSVTVVSFGPVKNAAATAAGGSGSSDNGATVVVNPDGTFTYAPPSGFIGIDKFAYVITTGNAPDNDAVVTISVGAAPSVTNDSYTAIGNVQINPTGTSNLLNNDAGNGIQIVAVNGNPANVGNTFTTANGSNLTVSANGDFIYNPGPGFDGPESFTYTIDNGFSSPQTATVSITISGMVWFINAAAAAGGDGRLSAPFNTIAAYNAAAGANPPAVNDNIFVFENAVAYTGSFTLLNGQRLIGQDATASLSTITGLTPAAYSSVFPVMNTGAPVTTLITTVAATNAVNLGSGNILRGLTLGNTTGSGINGTGFGTLVIADVSKNGTGQAVALTTGAFGTPATIDNITTTSSVNAVSLAGCTGTLTISTGAISGSTGSAFTINGGTCSVIYSGGITQANNAAMVSISGGHATGTITFQTGTLSATNGTGLQFDNADGNYNFNGTTTLNGGDAGIDIINGSNGTFSFNSNTSITNPSGTAININTSTSGNISYSGTFNKTNPGTGIAVNAKTGGTVTFNGTGTKTLSTSTGTAINLSNNTGATINFSGNNLLLTTTSGIGFNATGGGTVNITGTGNIVSSTTGVSVNLANTNIGASDLNFQSVSSNGASNGIVLSNTGSAGGIIVTGTGSANSGGIIQNTTGAGISLTNASNCSFSWMQITNTGSHGIYGTNMTDGSAGVSPTFSLSNSLLNSPGDADNESALYFDVTGVTNITGTMVITDVTIQNFEDVGFQIGNVSGTLTVNIDNCIINNNSDVNGEEGIDIDASGTATINVNITDSRFQDLEGGSMNIISQGSGTINLLVNNCIDIGTGGPDNFPTPPAMTFSAEGTSSNFFADITNNRILDASGDGIFFGHEGEISVRITGNIITGMNTGDGIRIDTDITGNQTTKFLIQNNQIGTVYNFESASYSGCGDDGIQILDRDGTKVMHLTISNNQIANTISEAIRHFADDDVAGGGPDNFLDITGNTFTNIGLPDAIVIISQDAGTNVCANITGNTFVGPNRNILVQQTAPSVLRIPQSSVAAIATANTNATSSSFGTITFNSACVVLLPVH